MLHGRFLPLLIMMLHLMPPHAPGSESGCLTEIQHETIRLLNAWYPRVADNQYHGFFPNWSYDWKKQKDHQKGIVTQARHTWSASRAAIRFPENKIYRQTADIGFTFLKDAMWDEKYGGFFEYRSRKGKYPNANGMKDTKRMYGNAFAIYALSAYYELTGNEEALDLAVQTYHWLENHSRDPLQGGYFNQLLRDGTPMHLHENEKTGWDASYSGLKDYNSGIHILEAYTRLYHVWPDSLLRKTLTDIFRMIRDKFITEKGYLHLFYRPDWTPVSFRDSTASVRRANFYLDHVSFGHDVETAYLMIEAADVLRLPRDAAFDRKMKRLVDHALLYGWDKKYGGLFEAAYYFKGDSIPTVVDRRKTWWVQAEALNAFLLMSILYPEDNKYQTCFKKQWCYIQNYLIDEEYGGWFGDGLDHQPENRLGRKGHHWKTSYHTLRALLNCADMLKNQKTRPE